MSKQNETRQRNIALLLLVLVVVGAFALRLERLSYATITYDEFRGTLNMIALPWKDLLLGRYDWEINPPLYFALLKGWALLWGDQEPLMRVFSLLLSMGSVLTAYLLGRRVGNSWVGLVFAGVLAFHPVYVKYALIIRMYALVLFLCVTALWCWAEYTFRENASRWWLAGMGAALVLAMYSHYNGIFLGLTLAVLCLAQWLLKRDKRQRDSLIILVICAVMLLPLVGLLRNQVGGHMEKIATATENNTPQIGLEIAAPLLSGNATFDFNWRNPLDRFGLIALGIGIVIALQDKRWVITVGIGVSLVLSIATALVMNRTGVRITERHLLNVSVLPWLLMCMVFLDMRTLISRTLASVALLTIGLTCLSGILITLRHDYIAPDWQAAAAAVEANIREGEVFVVTGWDGRPVSYYTDIPWISSDALDAALESDNRAPGYLILSSKNARVLGYVDYSRPLYAERDWHISLVRYVPGVLSAPTEDQ